MHLNKLITDLLEPVDEQVFGIVFGDVCHLSVYLPAYHSWFVMYSSAARRKNALRLSP